MVNELRKGDKIRIPWPGRGPEVVHITLVERNVYHFTNPESMDRNAISKEYMHELLGMTPDANPFTGEIANCDKQRASLEAKPKTGEIPYATAEGHTPKAN